LGSALADVPPARRVLPVGRPDRVLLFVIHDDLVDSRIVLFVPSHASLLSRRTRLLRRLGASRNVDTRGKHFSDMLGRHPTGIPRSGEFLLKSRRYVNAY